MIRKMLSQRHALPRVVLHNFRADQHPPTGKNLPFEPNVVGDDCFSVVEFHTTTGKLSKRPVSQGIASVKIYQDPGFQDNPYSLNEKLAKLEQQASEILRLANRALEQKEALKFSLQRKNILLRFLFLMRYRNEGSFDRLYNSTLQDYSGGDKGDLISYMKSKGFNTPRQVWFDTLRAFLDIELDENNHWIRNIGTTVYFYDAGLFIDYFLHQTMAFCRPKGTDNRFLLTGNAYSVRDGAKSLNLDPAQWNADADKNHLSFATISPKLIIILKHPPIGLPSETKRDPESVKTLFMLDDIFSSEKCVSRLRNLPIERSNVSYLDDSDTQEIRSRLLKKDEFYFRCFTLSSKDVYAINEMFLDKVWGESSIFFNNSSVMKLIREAYLPSLRVRLEARRGNSGERDRFVSKEMLRYFADPISTSQGGSQSKFLSQEERKLQARPLKTEKAIHEDKKAARWMYLYLLIWPPMCILIMVWAMIRFLGFLNQLSLFLNSKISEFLAS